MKCLSKPTGEPSLVEQYVSQGNVLPFRKSVMSMKNDVNISISAIVNFTLKHRAHI